eukprot:115678_1
MSSNIINCDLTPAQIKKLIDRKRKEALKRRSLRNQLFPNPMISSQSSQIRKQPIKVKPRGNIKTHHKLPTYSVSSNTNIQNKLHSNAKNNIKEKIQPKVNKIIKIQPKINHNIKQRVHKIQPKKKKKKKN